jgi:hypothetical protein
LIQQRVGDLLEIDCGGKYYYVVVLTKIVLFGGNIVFAYHTKGGKKELAALVQEGSGSNVCTDLLVPKREGIVTRLHRFQDLSRFWRSRYAKSTNEHRLGATAKEWFIYRLDQLDGKHVARVSNLTPEFRTAMDSGCGSFDLVAAKIDGRYTPDQNERI